MYIFAEIQLIEQHIEIHDYICDQFQITSVDSYLGKLLAQLYGEKSRRTRHRENALHEDITRVKSRRKHAFQQHQQRPFDVLKRGGAHRRTRRARALASQAQLQPHITVVCWGRVNGGEAGAVRGGGGGGGGGGGDEDYDCDEKNSTRTVRYKDRLMGSGLHSIA